MVEDDGVEVAAVVVGNEVFGGVGALQAARSDALVLQQRLVQGKQHLQEEMRRGRRGEEEGRGEERRGHFVHQPSHFSNAASGGIQHGAREKSASAASVPL